jgi:hypothetical protein
LYLKNRIIFFLYFFISYCLLFFSFHFLHIRLFRWFRFISFRFVFVDFVSFRFRKPGLLVYKLSEVQISYFYLCLCVCQYLWIIKFLEWAYRKNIFFLPFSSYQTISLVSFHFVSFRFCWFRFVSFSLISFRFVSFRFVSFRFYFVSHFIGTQKTSFIIKFVKFIPFHWKFTFLLFGFSTKIMSEKCSSKCVKFYTLWFFYVKLQLDIFVDLTPEVQFVQ